MAYNRFRWWSKGRPGKPLSDRAHIWDKIENNEYELSYMFKELEDERARAQKLYNEAYSSYKGSDEFGKRYVGYDNSRMARVRCMKLMEEAHKDEEKILAKLIADFSSWFGIDLEQILETIPPMDTKELYQYLNETYPRRTVPPVPRVWE